MAQTKSKASERQETSLEDACILHRIEGSETSFTGEIHWDWCGVIAAHGGILVSIILAAARKYSLSRYPSRDQPDPINSHIQFLNPVPIGPIVLEVRDINLGSRISVFQVELKQKDYKNGGLRVCTLGIITQGNLAREKGLSLPTTAMIPKAEIPDRKTDCEEMIYRPEMSKHAPVIFKNRGLVIKGGKEGTYNNRLGRNVRDIWYWRKDGKGFDVISLGQLLDSFPAAPGNYFPNGQDNELGIVFPTLSQTSEIKKDPKGAKWLFLRLVTHTISNGRFDTDGYLLDEDGDLVALTKHVSLITEPRGKPPVDASKLLKL